MEAKHYSSRMKLNDVIEICNRIYSSTVTCVQSSNEDRQLMHYRPESKMLKNLSLFGCMVPVTTSSVVTSPDL